MMRWKNALASLIVACLAVAVFIGIGAVRASKAQAGAAPQLTEAQVLDLQKRFQDASVAVDAATISSLMADDAIFVHGSAAVQTKAEYLASLTSGQMKLSTYKLNDHKVVLFDGGAIVNGMIDVGLVPPNGGEPRILHMRNSSVWVHKPAGWQLILNQGTPIAGPPRPPAQ
jgi:ketosteroid isomerase-like protein